MSETADKLSGFEAMMKTQMTEALYGGPQVDRRTDAQKARTPGYYWVKFDRRAWLA